MRVTLGPKSKCVLIDKGFGEPIVCNDGVTIAKELELKDPTENLGARMIREAAERMSQEVGDGTTTATLLAHAIFSEGVRNVSAGARLSGGVAVIHVGAPTEAELKSRKEAFEDAISATKAAVAEGIVPGGGLPLLRLIEAVEKEKASCECDDERTGLDILKHALTVPARQIAENSGADGAVVVERMRNSEGNVGFDAARNVFVDLVEAGIIDPTKVVRLALENAASVAGVLLLTEATLAESRPTRPEPMPAM